MSEIGLIEESFLMEFFLVSILILLSAVFFFLWWSKKKLTVWLAALPNGACVVDFKGKILQKNELFPEWRTQSQVLKPTESAPKNQHILPSQLFRLITNTEFTDFPKQVMLSIDEQTISVSFSLLNSKRVLLIIKPLQVQTPVYRNALYQYIHHLKSPLATAFLAVENLDIMLSRASDKTEITEVLNELRQAIQQTNTQTQKLVLFTRSGQRYRGKTDLAVIINSAVVKTDPSGRLTEQIASPLPLLTADAKALQLALETLLRICLKYKAAGADLTISAARQAGVKNTDGVIVQISSRSAGHSGFNKKRLLSFQENDQTDLFFINIVLINHHSYLEGGIDLQQNIFYRFLLPVNKEAE